MRSADVAEISRHRAQMSDVVDSVRAACAGLTAVEIAKAIGAFADGGAVVGVRREQLAALWLVLFERAREEGLVS